MERSYHKIKFQNFGTWKAVGHMAANSADLRMMKFKSAIEADKQNDLTTELQKCAAIVASHGSMGEGMAANRGTDGQSGSIEIS